VAKKLAGSFIMMQCVDASALINGRRLFWKAWGDPTDAPVLALHGWLDNAASFDVLAPLLDGVYLVAPDMPGHGFSDHREPPGSYNIWDDLLDMLALADHLEWDKFQLLGHSRGAIIATVLAGSVADRITGLALLDGILVGDTTEQDAAQQMGKYLADQRRQPSKPRSYADIESAMAVRCKAAAMSQQAAKPIVERGLYQSLDGQWHWRSDWRLTLASAVKFTREQALSFYRDMQCPALAVLASEGFRQHSLSDSLMEQLAALIDIQHEQGSHHWHLEAAAENIASRLGPFLQVNR
jgi:pimeloyl-ACP methyl ester carboxylesterase